MAEKGPETHTHRYLWIREPGLATGEASISLYFARARGVQKKEREKHQAPPRGILSS